MRCRVIVQDTNDGYKHVKSWTVDTPNPAELVKRLQEATRVEREQALDRFNEFLSQREVTGVQKILDETPHDALPIQDKGTDVSNRTFLENEIYLMRID